MLCCFSHPGKCASSLQPIPVMVVRVMGGREREAVPFSLPHISHTEAPSLCAALQLRSWNRGNSPSLKVFLELSCFAGTVRFFVIYLHVLHFVNRHLLFSLCASSLVPDCFCFYNVQAPFFFVWRYCCCCCCPMWWCEAEILWDGFWYLIHSSNGCDRFRNQK